MLSSFAVGAAVWDGSGRVLMADEAYLSLLHWDRDKLSRLTREVTHPDDRGRTLQLLDRQRRDGRPFEIAKRYVRADGHAVWVENRVSLLAGESPGVLVLSRPLPEAETVRGVPTQAGRMALADAISETATSLSLQARRFGLARTAGLLDAVGDGAVPEAQGAAAAG